MRVDGGRFTFGDGLQVRAVIAHGAVAGGGVAERVAVDVGGGQPGEEAAESRRVGAAAVGIQWGGLELFGVAGAEDLEVGGQAGCRSC